MLKTVLLTAVAGLALAASVASSPAIAITFAGFTDGCFGVACVPPTSAPPQQTNLGGLSYLGSSFAVTTVGGFAAIGSSATPNVNNLGSFTLTGDPNSYSGNPFNLRVTFTSPLGTSPGTAIISAVLTGGVTSVTNGGVWVDFDNTPQAFTFPGGSFTFAVNDVSMTAGSGVPVSGQIFEVAAGPLASTPLPPASHMMLIGGLVVGFIAYRRKSKPALMAT